MDPTYPNMEDEFEYRQFLENQLEKFLQEFDQHPETTISVEDYMQMAFPNDTDVSETPENTSNTLQHCGWFDDATLDWLHKIALSTVATDSNPTIGKDMTEQMKLTGQENGLNIPLPMENNFHSLLKDFELFEETMLPPFSKTSPSKTAINSISTEQTISTNAENVLEVPQSTQNMSHTLPQDFELFEKTMLTPISETASSTNAINSTATEHTIATTNEYSLGAQQSMQKTFHSILHDFELFEKATLPPLQMKPTPLKQRSATIIKNGSNVSSSNFTNCRDDSCFGAGGKGAVRTGSSTLNKFWVPIKISGGITALKLVTANPLHRKGGTHPRAKKKSRRFIK